MRQTDLKGGRKGKTMILQGQLPAWGAFTELQAGPWEALAWELQLPGGQQGLPQNHGFLR